MGHVSGHYVENSIKGLVEYSEKTKLQFEIEFEIGGIFVCFVAKIVYYSYLVNSKSIAMREQYEV